MVKPRRQKGNSLRERRWRFGGVVFMARSLQSWDQSTAEKAKCETKELLNTAELYRLGGQYPHLGQVLRLQTGRRMPSLRMRACRVVRFMPRRIAAPRGPAIRHWVWRRARRICWRSASSKVAMDANAGGALDAGAALRGDSVAVEIRSEAGERSRNSGRGTRSSLPGERRTARSTRFSSSRTLPGQG